MSPIYPFAAIVGQEQLKQALLICAVDPTVGGVLVRGDKGSAKSTAARGLAAVLPAIRRATGCGYNCEPEHPLPLCPVCSSGARELHDGPVPFINLPLGATEDRVLGSLDFEKALQGGKQAFKPGLLAAAHRGMLYIDEVNLLADHLVDVLLDAAAMGVNTVEREGLAVSHPARVTLLGTMNQEEGDLRPQLLDRFGLMVDVAAPREPALRAEVVRRRLAFEADPAGFAAQWQTDSEALRENIAAARALLPQTRLSDSLFHFVSELCCEFDVSSLRADIVLNKAARALAALDGRIDASAEDIRDAARLVLPHRRRRKPFEQSGLDQDKLEQMTRQASNPPPPPPPPSPQEQNHTQPDADGEQEPHPSSHGSEQIFAASPAGDIARIRVQAPSLSDAAGRRSDGASRQRGHYVRAEANPQPAQLAVDATLRHAILRDPDNFSVTRADLHDKVRVAKQGNLILLVVDASGSMAARQRMEQVKGTVLSLLEDAYRRRDQVALIAFRGQKAELLLPPCNRVEQAELALRELPTGGRTPLAHALALAADTLSRQLGGPAPLLVILSDGRANVALDGDGDPWRQALELAGQLAGAPALVLDTEQDFVRLGRARELAEALGAEYLACDALTGEQLTLTIQQRLGR
ncbi:putative cobaltochelatase [Chromobacterium violaceum]|uniref:putative cobaltochelatase n=1 Tax=Chromobacterium violaceum TaxID=536 RepID=UPI001CE11133|nr:putative cobaltochelatase [Chromobacterium violaceum]